MQTSTGRRRRRDSRPASGRRPAPLASDETLAAGRVLFDRYRLEERIGRGGVADVWRARDLRLDRLVAIKILHPHLLPDEAWRRRFVAEARAASGLSHPGIVPVYDVLDDAVTPAIVFQLVEGESLDARLGRVGVMPLAEATRIGAGIAAALDHAHRAGVIHRDVKPSNIVIDAEGRARLVDFGIARVIEDAGAELTAEHDVVGTLRYMAPEQLEGRHADERTDLYALGLVMAELVPDLESAPGWFRELVGRLRAPEPADRPSSAADVARALETGPIDGDRVASPADVTRTFEPTALALASPPPATAPPPAAVPVPAAVPAPTAAILGRSPVVAGGQAARLRADNRPVVVAILVVGLLLGGLAIAQRGLFVAPAGGGASQPPATVAPVATEAPPAGPKDHKGRGHGPGG